jgi:5-oxoprolinase (ATP-hydrolysing) subunit A
VRRSYPDPVRIDLNADLGEGMADDATLLEVVTSANVATGAHAGGGRLLERTVAAAVAGGVAVGAHPSYRDRAGFGRRSLLESLRHDPGVRAAFVADLVEQVLAVAHAAGRAGGALGHVKAHGALYNEAVLDPLAAAVVTEAVQVAAQRCGCPLAVVTQPAGVLAEVAAAAGLVVHAEGFVDRGYRPDGGLVPRGTPGALLPDVPAMVEQALALAGGSVATADGGRIALAVDTLCVHGDTPQALAAARAVRDALEAAGWQVVAPGSPR